MGDNTMRGKPLSPIHATFGSRAGSCIFVTSLFAGSRRGIAAAAALNSYMHDGITQAEQATGHVLDYFLSMPAGWPPAVQLCYNCQLLSKSTHHHDIAVSIPNVVGSRHKGIVGGGTGGGDGVVGAHETLQVL